MKKKSAAIKTERKLKHVQDCAQILTDFLSRERLIK